MKFAVEGISEGLQYELAPIGIKVKVIEPGAIETDFAGRSFDFTTDESLTEYEGVVNNLWDGFGEALGQAAPAALVAEEIMKCVTDGSEQMRYPVGDDAIEALAARTSASDEVWFAGMRERFKL